MVTESDSLGSANSLFLGMFSGPSGPVPGHGVEVLQRIRTVDLQRLIHSMGTFHGDVGASMVAVLDDGMRPVAVRFVGLGPRHLVTRQGLFDAALAASRAGNADASLLALELPDDPAAVGAVVEGHRMGAWRYGRAMPATVAVVSERDAAEAIARAELIADATNWVRELVEMPPNILTPSEFALRIARFAERTAGERVTVTSWDAELLTERGFGGTLGVGAAHRSSTMVVELSAAGTGPVTALAGKGITFDSGGINLKRDPGEIAWMKSDMAAAASVAAAVVVASALGSPRSLHAVLPITENMPGSMAQRPGDVVTHPDGRTTEVSDTDSEGRLVLADALAWLAATRPAELIDVGTLTDSGSLGTAFWGCWSNSDALSDSLIAAGERSGDRGWRLPLHDSYLALLESRVADLRNAPADAPDTGVVAATYLSSFVGTVPWAHIDNGSGAWLEWTTGGWPDGPTGTPTRALIEYLVSPL